MPQPPEPDPQSSPTAENSADAVALEAKSIVKRFPGVMALKGVSFDLKVGEIHALCGENGAGKSTLIKVLSGIHSYGSYEGDFLFHGDAAEFRNARDSEQAGISVVHQELSLVGELSVAENLFLGQEPRKLGSLLIDWHELHQKAHQLLDEYDIKLDFNAPVHSLGIGQQQLIEILKALSHQPKVLILDEPTAALTRDEIERLVGILKRLRSAGTACIYISHKLDEVLELADRITVLRDGESILTMDRNEASEEKIVTHMVGREIEDFFPRHDMKRGEAILTISELSVSERNDSDIPRLKEISFTLHKGEVLGIGGLIGAGRTELLMHLVGMWGNRTGGSVTLQGVKLESQSPREVMKRGMVLVSEERRRYGLVLDHSVNNNISLASLSKFTKNGFINHHAEHLENAQSCIDLKVKTPSLLTHVGTLSGGNQQKVVLGKALMREPEIILLDEPTRGIDVGAKVEIYELINALTEAGKAVLLVSSEMPELMGMSDRILMMHEGIITGTFNRDEASEEKLLNAAMGVASHTSK